MTALRRYEWHGMTDTREHSAWGNMKSRCYNPNTPKFRNHGGRGIKVCASWLHSFSSFYADMGQAPEGKSLDRIDTNGNYEPGNCRWATPLEQSNNMRGPRNNVSGIPGVFWNKNKGRWDAYINYDKKRTILGCHSDFFEACCARKSAEQNIVERTSYA